MWSSIPECTSPSPYLSFLLYEIVSIHLPELSCLEWYQPYNDVAIYPWGGVTLTHMPPPCAAVDTCKACRGPPLLIDCSAAHGDYLAW